MHSFVGRVMIYISSIFYTDNWLLIYNSTFQNYYNKFTHYWYNPLPLLGYRVRSPVKMKCIFFYWKGMRFRDK
jgi:hypothetical protein